MTQAWLPAHLLHYLQHIGLQLLGAVGAHLDRRCHTEKCLQQGANEEEVRDAYHSLFMGNQAWVDS